MLTFLLSLRHYVEYQTKKIHFRISILVYLAIYRWTVFFRLVGCLINYLLYNTGSLCTQKTLFSIQLFILFVLRV